jgi:hypothetical protein
MKAFLLFFGLCLLLLWHPGRAQPEILVKGMENVLAVRSEITAYLELLEIREKVHITVKYTRRLPGNMKGLTLLIDTALQAGYRHIGVWIDTGLEAVQRQLVLAHEMIHVKQFVKGELFAFGQKPVYWKGKKYYKTQYNRRSPWELEAYKEDEELREQLLKMIPGTHSKKNE